MLQMASYSPARAWRSVSRCLVNKRLYLFLLLCWISNTAHAAADMQTVLTNLSNLIIPLTGMVLLVSFCSGVYMVIHALTLMKKFGTISQTQHGEIGGPLMKLMVGTVLIYLPTSTDTMMNSLFNTGASMFGYGTVSYQNLGAGSSLLNYVSADSMSIQWAALANTLVLYIQFLGFLSFIKGWFIMSRSAGQGAQQGSFTKALTHIIGGIFAINFVGMVHIINNTLNGP